MRDPLVVRRLQRLGDLPGVVERRRDRQRPAKRLAFHQLHDQRAIFHAIDLRDVGVVQGGQHLGFAFEAGQPFGIVREGVRKNLDGYFAIELCVPGAIHLAHAARAERRQDFVGAEFVARG